MSTMGKEGSKKDRMAERSGDKATQTSLCETAMLPLT